MSWYYELATGDIFERTGFLKWETDREIDREKLVAAIPGGFPQHVFGPFATRDEAQAFKSTHPSVVDQAKAGVKAAENAVQQPVHDVTSAIAAVGNQLVKLGLRLVEAAVGIVLLAIAANAIIKQATGVDVAGAAVRAGKKTGKAAAAAAAV